MSALHVAIRPNTATNRKTTSSALVGFFDLVVDGVNLTARLGESQALAMLTELGHGVLALTTAAQSRSTVELHGELEVWELGMVRLGDEVSLHLYAPGQVVQIVVDGKKIALQELREAVCRAISETLDGRPGQQDAILRPPTRLKQSLKHLHESLSQLVAAEPRAKLQLLDANTPLRGKLIGKCQLNVLVDSTPQSKAQVERADLLSLFARGDWSISAKKSQHKLEASHALVVFDLERMIEMSSFALETMIANRPYFRRINLTASTLTMRNIAGDISTADLILRDSDGREQSLKAPLDEIIGTIAALGRAVVEAYITANANHRSNLRLSELELASKQLLERLHERRHDEDEISNQFPENYRAFAVVRRRVRGDGRWSDGGKMRFAPRWVATVPGLDLGAFFLCGDRLIVGGNRETACIERESGELLWKTRTRRAATAASPSGIARVEPDGTLTVLELETGLPRFTRKLAPRSSGGVAGTVVHESGLPRLFIVAEGENQISAIDLNNGNLRWRYSAKRPGQFKLRRAGKLVLISGGGNSLSALDVATGELVWRIREKQIFNGALSVDKDSAFAVTGNPASGWFLNHYDLWTGTKRFSTAIDERPASGHGPLFNSTSVIIPVVDEQEAGLCAFDRRSGDLIWEHTPGLIPSQVSWLAMDDVIIGNSASGVLLCLDAATGHLRYNHVFSQPVEGDQPRRLDPVVRDGALFVPQSQVFAIRPRDGELIGTVPADLVPDLFRVDENCGVYIAEESGHIAAFSAAAKLELVRRR